MWKKGYDILAPCAWIFHFLNILDCCHSLVFISWLSSQTFGNCRALLFSISWVSQPRHPASSCFLAICKTIRIQHHNYCQKIIKEYIKRIVCYKKCRLARQEIIDCMLYSGNPGSGWDPVVFLFLFVYVFVFVFVLVFAGDPPSAWKPWEKCIRRLHSSPPRSCTVHLVPWCLHRCRMLLPPTGQALCWNSPVIIHALFPLVIISHFYNSDSVWKPFSWRRKSLKTSVLGCLNVISDDWNSYQSIIIWEKAFDHHSPSQTLPKPWGSQSSWSPLHPCASTETPQLDMLLSKNVSIISST